MPGLTRDQAAAILKAAADGVSTHGLSEFTRVSSNSIEWKSDPQSGGVVVGQGSIIEALTNFRKAFPDLHVEIDFASLVFEEPVASFEFVVTGTHKETLGNIGVTGRSVRFRGSGTATFRPDHHDDWVIERLSTRWNCARVMAQLGMRSYARPGPVPTPPPAAVAAAKVTETV